MQEVHFAIVDSNVLSCIGLRNLLEGIIPSVTITTFNSFEELVVNHPEKYMHFFVSSAIYFEHAQYFISQPRKSIVLVHGEMYPHLNKLLTLNVCQDEKLMVKSLLKLHQRGQSARGITTAPRYAEPMTLLSSREVDVAILLARGYINKEIAEKLNISLTTVITHRKNIMDKLKARSLADIIIHVVMNGLIAVDEL